MDLDRFRKVLGMLGSDQPGERSAAALKATEMLRESGVDWSAVSVNQSGDQKSGAGGDLNALMRALEEVQSLKSALRSENIRNSILTGQLEALVRQSHEAAEAEVREIPPPKEKKPMRTGSLWGL